MGKGTYHFGHDDDLSEIRRKADIAMGEQLLGSPRPGHGRVFVNCNRHGEWSASWQDDYPEDEVRDGEPSAGVEDFEGTEDGVTRWARTRPAEEFFIFSDEANAYLPLEPADAAELPAAAEHRQRAEEAVQVGVPAEHLVFHVLSFSLESN